MKAIMLIAGKGTRLKPLTNDVPKCCLPINDVPLLEIWIRKLEQSGVTRLLLNPGGCLNTPTTEYVLRTVWGAKQHPPIKQITLRCEQEPIGTAQTILQNADWIGDDDFFIIYGDVLTDINLRRLRNAHRQSGATITLAAYRTEKASQKGILEVKNGWAVSFEEKPKLPKSTTAFAGIAISKPNLLNYIDRTDGIDLGSDVLPVMAAEPETVRVYQPRLTYFKDIGTITDYHAAQTEWRQLHAKD